MHPYGGVNVDELVGAITLAFVSVMGLYTKVCIHESRRHVNRHKSEHRREDCLRRQLKSAAVSETQAMKVVITGTGSINALGGTPLACMWHWWVWCGDTAPLS
jgi:hypothetical protein